MHIQNPLCQFGTIQALNLPGWDSRGFRSGWRASVSCARSSYVMLAAPPLAAAGSLNPFFSWALKASWNKSHRCDGAKGWSSELGPEVSCIKSGDTLSISVLSLVPLGWDGPHGPVRSHSHMSNLVMLRWSCSPAWQRKSPERPGGRREGHPSEWLDCCISAVV